MLLRASHLYKDYSKVAAVNDVSLQVGRGEIFGLLGPNGAGKTTTIRMILHIILPDKGEVLIDEKPYTAETTNRFGYLPEERGLYRKSTLRSTLRYFAEL